MPDAPNTPNLAAAVDSLLGSLGVTKVAKRDQASEIVAEELARRGHQATMVELRWGELVLETDQLSAAFLRYDLDQLQERLSELLPGVVTAIKVRVRR